MRPTVFESSYRYAIGLRDGIRVEAHSVQADDPFMERVDKADR